MPRERHSAPNLDIDPSMIIIGLGYATGLVVAIGWLATSLA
jgi:hypothetical protein